MRWRAWPVVEVGLIVAVAVVVAAVLAFLVLWHVRWRGMIGVVPPEPAAGDPVVQAEFVRWYTELRVAGDEAPVEREDLELVLSGMDGEDAERARMAATARDHLGAMLRRGLRCDGRLQVEERVTVPERLEELPGGFECLRLAAQGWVVDATDRERAPAALAGCDGLVAAMSPPTSSDAFGEWVRAVVARDDAYVVAALAGTAPAATARWRAEMDPVAVWLATSARARADRRGFLAGIYAQGPWGMARREGFAWPWSWPATRKVTAEWWAMPSACAQEDAAAVAAEDDVRARRVGTCGAWTDAAGWALAVALRHRLAALAMTVLAARTPPRGDFPATLPAMDLAAGPDRVALRVTHDARRFAIEVDPQVPMAPYIAAACSPGGGRDEEQGVGLDWQRVSVDLDQPEVVGMLLRVALADDARTDAAKAVSATGPAVATGGTASGAGVAP